MICNWQFRNRIQMLKYKNYIYAAVAILALLGSGVAVVKHKVDIHHQQDPLANTIIELQNPIKVKQINVLNGDEFDLMLEDGRRIHAILDVRSTPDAKSEVLSFVNRCFDPRIVIQQQKGDVWIVSMWVTTTGTDGQNVEVSLAKWLREKRLAYD